ncbi:glycosyltransferase family 39 protein [Patescibacteria group bacterium]|jgi:hypothetical protein|nr:glycosyltransferase family 39 protein [Patescibacteria group bacterium]
MLNKKIQNDLLIFILYAIIFLILTFPLVLNFCTSIIAPYDSDGPIFLWNAWHLEKNILAGNFSLYTDYLFYPQHTPLGLHTYSQFQSILTFIINLLAHNLVFSFNLVYLLSVSLCAYFTYKFFQLLNFKKSVSFLAGILFAFQPLWSIYALFGTQNFLQMWYVPATLYFYEKFRQTNKPSNAFLVGLVIASAFINDFYPFVFSLAGLAIYSLCINFQKIFKLFRHYLRLAIFSLLGFLIVACWKIFLLWEQKDFISKMPKPSLQDIDSLYFADPVNLFRPVQWHFLWGSWSTWFGNFSLQNGNAFLGFSFALLIILFLLIKIRKKTSWQNKRTFIIFLTAYLLILSLSFGPYLHFFGINTHWPMPDYFLAKIFPSFNHLRFPARWLILGQIFFCGIFISLLAYLQTNLSAKIYKILFVCLTLALILEVMFLPRSMMPIFSKENELIQQIAKQTDNKTVLTIPMAISSGYFDLGETHKKAMAYQIIHQKPIIEGHLSRLPLDYKNYAQEPIIKYFLNYQNTQLDNTDLDAENIKQFFNYYQLGYIIIDKQKVDLTSNEGKILLNYLQTNLNFQLLAENQYQIIFQR